MNKKENDKSHSDGVNMGIWTRFYGCLPIEEQLEINNILDKEYNVLTMATPYGREYLLMHALLYGSKTARYSFLFYTGPVTYRQFLQGISSLCDYLKINTLEALRIWGKNEYNLYFRDSPCASCTHRWDIKQCVNCENSACSYLEFFRKSNTV